MTVPAQTRRSSVYTGNGVTLVFPFSFKVFAATDIQVLVTSTAGVLSTATYLTDYSVTLNPDQSTAPGGSINYQPGFVPLATGAKLVIIGALPYDQPLSLPGGGNFNPAAIENEFDRTQMQIQQIAAGLQATISVPVGETVPVLPAAAQRANYVLGFDSLGNPTVVIPTSGSVGTLATDLLNAVTPSKGAGQVGFNSALTYPASTVGSGITAALGVTSTLGLTALAAQGAGQVGFKGTLNYVGLTIGARLLDLGSSPRSLGATGDGVADDTAFIVAALTYSKTLDLRNHAWKITSTVSLPAGCTIIMDGASIVAACGATPIFSFLAANAGLTIYHGGSGSVSGTASCFLFAQGTTNTPTSFSHYASLINIYGLRINSATITTGLVFDKAVNSVVLHAVDFFCPNGIDASGANIAVMISNSIIFSATGTSGTRGIKLRSTGGTVYYNQGWQVVNSTVDNFEISHDIADVFDYSITGGYHGCNASLAATTGYVVQFQAPTGSNLTDTITIGGGTVIFGRIRFAASAGGQAYNAYIDGLFVGAPGTAVAIENNASNISIKGMFKASSGTGIAVVGSANNNNITTDVEVDSSYTNGVVLNGTVGTNCYVDARGPCTGDIIGAGRANIRYGAKVPIHSTAVAAQTRVFSAANLGAGATYAVAVAISTQAWTFARGETGDIVIHLPYSGANAATQNLQIGLPAGMVIASGTGWAANNLYLGAANGLLSVRVPYYCTTDGSGNVTLTNQAGNTLTVINQAYAGIVRRN